MKILDFLNPRRKSSKKAQKNIQNMDGVVFYDPVSGRYLGRGRDAFESLNSGNNKPSFYEITKEAFGRSPWVYIIVDRIAKACMNIPIDLVNMEGELISPRMRQTVKVRELERLLTNPQSSFNGYSFDKLTYSTVSNFLLTGNGYMVGFPHNVDMPMRYTDLINPLTQNVSPNDDGRSKVSFYTVNYFNQTFSPFSKDVMHMSTPNLTSDSFEGHSSLQSLVNIWKANNAVNENEQFIHERKGSSGIMHSKSRVAQTPTERVTTQKELDKVISASSRKGRFSWLGTEVGYIDLSKSFKELEADSSKNAQRETIAAAYNYPVQLLNDTSSTTYNNVREMDKTAYTKAVLPVYDFYLKELNKWLVSENYGLQTVKIGYDINAIPEMNLVNADKTDNNAKKLKMVLEVNQAVASGSMSKSVAVNTLVMAGFNEMEANGLVTRNINQGQ